MSRSLRRGLPSGSGSNGASWSTYATSSGGVSSYRRTLPSGLREYQRPGSVSRVA